MALVVVFGLPMASDASTSTAATIALQNVKLVSYEPADASWTNMWTEFEPAQIGSDFARVEQLGANTVRITIDPDTFGWPAVTPTMANELQQVISLAQSNGLHVELTLFNWWTQYGQIAESEAWLGSLLTPYSNDPEIAFVELQNEIDPTNTQAMTWARALMPVAQQLAGNIPVTISTMGTEGLTGVLALKAALAGDPPSFYDFHYYDPAGEAAAVLGSIKAAVAPATLFVGEAGMSTYSASGESEETMLASDQASYFATVEEATASLGLPAAGVYMLSDLDGADVPYPESVSPADWDFGIYNTDGSPKPAAAVVEQFFSDGTVPILLDAGFETGANGVPTGWAPRGKGR